MRRLCDPLFLFFLITIHFPLWANSGYDSDANAILPGTHEMVSLPNSPLNKISQNRKFIYFTFDDGPLSGSENIDSIILAENLKVSVFLVGMHVQKSHLMENYLKYYSMNPFIDEYNHSFTHAKGKYEEFYRNPAVVVADIMKNQTFLKLPYKIVRLPGRNMWRIGNRKRDDVNSGSAAADSLAKLGFRVIGWDLEWQHDSRTGTPIQSVDEMEKEIERMLSEGATFTKDHLVILLHDEMFQKKWEESELKQLIDRLRTHDNYVFEQIRFYPLN